MEGKGREGKGSEGASVIVRSRWWQLAKEISPPPPLPSGDCKLAYVKN